MSLTLYRIVAIGLLVAVCAPGELAAGGTDWPMWQYDAARSADTPLELPEELHLQWKRELPEPKRAWRFQRDHRGKLDFDISCAPVVMGDQIFVPSNVTDSVTAYGIQDGREQWRFYADGPVRLAPAAWKGRVYFVSDDGYLYCVRAESGELVWRFRGGPSDHRLLGNERIINLWAARGGPVLKEGEVYFGAGLWPLHGIFIYALDAQSGEVIWVNDTTSSDYVKLPHGGATGYGGIAPQGYLAASEDQLVVAGGRGMPAYLNRHSGKVEKANFRAKPDGGYAVHAIDGGGLGKKTDEMLEDRVRRVSDEIDGEVFEKLAARDRLFVTTKSGTLYCFGPDEVETVDYEYSRGDLRPHTNHWANIAKGLLNELGETEGYGLVLGAGSGDLFRELLTRSRLHLVVVEDDSGQVRELRDELVDAGVYGRRAALIEANPAEFSVQPYLFSVVVSENAHAAGIGADESDLGPVLNLMRPYGGVAWLGISPDELPAARETASAADVDRVSVKGRYGGLFAERGGPLSGAGEWTHQYQDSANTLLSRDERVQLPLGVLWFGGPSNHNILPRHARGPKPQVAGGRQVFLGRETIAARCVYTGRQLWERKFPGIGHPFTNMKLERKWRKGKQVYMNNIPGASLIGSPFVTLSDSVYLRYEGDIYRLDPATGETLNIFEVPGRPVEELYGNDAPEWGHVSVRGNCLITTSEPNMFEDQKLGWEGSYSGTSSRRLVVMDRYDGEVLWERRAEIGFRHGAIVSADDTLYVIDGLSRKALGLLGRRGEEPHEASKIMALALRTGEKRWTRESKVFGTFLQYSEKHDLLLEGGNQDVRGGAAGEPLKMAVRRGGDGSIVWQTEEFKLPAVIKGDMLIAGLGETPGKGGRAVSLLTGEPAMREQPPVDERNEWRFHQRKGCGLVNGSENLLLFRSGYAAYFDLEHDSGTGFLSGFKSGCTANMIAADGVLNALDYTRTCTCSYPQQTSLALVPMPGNSNIEFWTRYEGATPDPVGHGINFGAPGRRPQESGLIWHEREGTKRRHPSAIVDSGGSMAWVAASVRELREEGSVVVEDLLDARYTVRLHFAEIDRATGRGQRVFDVFINHEKVLNNFDILDETDGVFRAVVKEFSVDCDGRLTLRLRSTFGSELAPVISGIEMRAQHGQVAGQSRR